MALNGFSVLAWVKPDSSLLHGLTEDTQKEMIAELLKDFQCLLGCRWNMDIHITCIEGVQYAFGINNRITASEKTITNAIGLLAEHVAFLRGTASNSAEELARFKECKRKWKVPDEVSTTSYGWEAVGQAGTSNPTKRRHF